MAIDRVTINLPEGTLAILKKRAELQKRTVSNFVSLLAENDLQAAGLLGSSGPAELLAAAEEVGIEKALAILKRAARRREGVAA